MVQALKKNKTLTVLNLNENNHIGDKGAEAFAAALNGNNSLAGIDLSNSNITETGIAFLAAALKLNRNVTTLHLTDNGRDEASEAHFRDCLSTNMTLCHLPGISGLDDLLNRNLERQISLAVFAREGNLVGMQVLIEGGVGREVSLTSGLSIYHLCMDSKRSDMLDLLLCGTSGVGQGFFDIVGLLEGRRSARQEMRRFVEVRMVAFHCSWRRLDEGSFSQMPRELMDKIARGAFESWPLPYRQNNQ
jgi:hypothetical protein